MGAGRIKGITIEVEGNTTKLVDSMKKVDSEVRRTQNSLRDVNKLLKLKPGNTELLTQKQKMLTQAIDQTKTRLRELEAAQDKVGKGTAEWDTLQREIIETKSDLEKLEREYREFGSVAAQQVAAAGAKMQTVGTKMSDIGRDMTMYVTVPLAAAGTAGVKKFAEVDKTMKLVESTMGNVKWQAGDLDKAMKSAAANSTFGMNDAAQASLNFARAGLDAKQASEILAPAMNLAAAQAGDLNTVSSNLVGTMLAFGETNFGNASRYADIFANACNNSKLEINSMTEAMGIAAPVFNAAGYEVKDAALYMGVMANANIDASTAANALKTGMARLVAPTAEASAWMNKLNISVTNADGTMKDSVTLQKELHSAFSGLSESERLAAASAIFGKNQMSNWLALINTAPGEVEKLSASLDKEGTVAKQAEDMMSGFGGSMEKLKSSIDVAATSLGEALAPTISKVAAGIQKAVDWFNSLDKSQQQMIAKVGLIVAAIGPALLVGGKLVSGIGSMLMLAPKIVRFGSTIVKAFKLVRVAAAALSFNPVILAIGAAIAIGVLLYKNWDKIKAKAKELKEKVSATWNEFKSNTVNKFTAIKDAISSKMDEAKLAAKNKADQLKNGVSAVWQFMTGDASTKYEMIKSLITNKMEEAKNLAKIKADLLKAGVSLVWDGLNVVTNGKFEAIRSSIASKMESARSSAQSKANALKDSMSSAWESARSAAVSKFESIRSGIVSKIDSARSSIKSTVSKIKGMFPFNIGRLINFTRPSISLRTATRRVLGKSITYPTGFSVSWYKRGYLQPIEFKKPTVMATAAGMQGFGDGPGSEIVMGKRMLMNEFASHAAAAAARVANSSYTFNIYAGPGQDAREIAREVERIMVEKENQRKAAFA